MRCVFNLHPQLISSASEGNDGKPLISVKYLAYNGYSDVCMMDALIQRQESALSRTDRALRIACVGSIANICFWRAFDV